MTDDDFEEPVERPFEGLSPDLVVAAVEQATGGYSDGRVLALGSYENRVFQVGIEDGEPVVVKFYRPGRWTDESILEEHAFALELAAAEIPVVAPLVFGDKTLLTVESEAGATPDPDLTETNILPQPFASPPQHFRYAVYPRRGGQWPELGTSDDRKWMGRFLGRIHAVGAAGRFQHRPRLGIDWLGYDAVNYLLDAELMPDYVARSYEELTDEMLAIIEQRFEWGGMFRYLRIHGDCHRNNVLWTPEGPHFVDLDDCMTGPAIQDIWMLLAGNREEMRAQLADMVEGYQQFNRFDEQELVLIEPLRALRMIHYAAWLARRWHDPAFPRAFPWFGEPRYWEEHLQALAEQRDALEQPAITL